MEQAQYWMWRKRKHENYNHGDSWKEQSFVEDNAGGYLGDYTWPPRSYSCSFCAREFKSAQALGGHMNVHRRDRARLKQSPNPPSHQPLSPQVNNFRHPFEPMDSQQKFSFMYDQNSDSEKCVRVRSPTSNKNPIRVCDTKKHDNDKNVLVSPLHSSLVLHDNREVDKSLSAESWSSSVQDREYICANDHLKNGEKGYHYQMFDSKCSGDETNLSLNLDLLVFRSRVNATLIHEDMISSCKRRKMEAPPYLALLSRSNAEVFPSISDQVVIEGLDLELRLGDPPKVK